MKKIALLSLLITAAPAFAAESKSGSAVPIYKITITAGSIQAINYQNLNGSTEIDFRGTVLLPKAEGEADVKSKNGIVKINAEFVNLEEPSRFGPEYLTYVLWAISPEGRATNLGELIVKNGKSKIEATTQLQTFGLLVTAEPYYAVTQVSDVVVLENMASKDTNGKVEGVEAKYELLERGQYAVNVNPADLQPIKMDKKTPFYLYQARNAVQIAKWSGAEAYATDAFSKAHKLLADAESYNTKKGKYRRQVPVMSRQAVQTAEDARLIALKRQTEAGIAQIKQEASSAKDQAMRMKDEADLARTDASVARGQADMALDEVNRTRQQSEREKAELRAQLNSQLNAILETRDSARGLIVNMSDVLFESGKYTLKPEMREKLAKMAGVILSHPGLKLEVEGHTDSVGSDASNQTLSERRADAVRSYLVSQGIDTNMITSRGFGEGTPIASNDTDAGRRQNRRVEAIVSGDIIGTQIESRGPASNNTR